MPPPPPPPRTQRRPVGAPAPPPRGTGPRRIGIPPHAHRDLHADRPRTRRAPGHHRPGLRVPDRGPPRPRPRCGGRRQTPLAVRTHGGRVGGPPAGPDRGRRALPTARPRIGRTPRTRPPRPDARMISS